MIKKIPFIFLFFLFCVPANFVFAVGTNETRPFDIFYPKAPLEIKEQKVTVQFLFSVPDKFYLYKDEFALQLTNQQLKSQLILPAAEKKYDEFKQEELEIYHNDVLVSAEISVPANFNDTKITGHLLYQGCSDKICYRVMREPFTFTLSKQHEEKPSQPQSVSSSEPSKNWYDFLNIQNFSDSLKNNLWQAVLFAFLAGIVTSFTPCVLPIIPLTLAFMGVSERESFSKRLGYLLIFIFGLIVTNTLLGTGAAVLGQTLGFLFQSRLFLILMILFFLFMGLSMLGFFTLQLPVGLQTKIQKYQPVGYLRNFYSGLTIGLLAAPCVGPIQGPLLVFIAQSKDILLGLFLMTSYSLGLSLLFFALGFLSKTWFKKFGAKTLWVKRITGLALILVAIFYAGVLVKPLLPELIKDPVQNVFLKDFSVAVAQAKKQNKPMIIDFFAEWCAPCHQWNRQVFSQAEVQKKMQENFIAVKIDCTVETEQCAKAIADYQIIGWPTLVFLDKSFKEIKAKRLTGVVLTPSEFINHLQTIQDLPSQ